MRRKVIASLFFVLALGLSVATADEVERWLRDARSPVLQVRLHALRVLGDSGDVRAISPLLTALRDENSTIRDCAVAALHALVRTLQGIYTTVAQWIAELLTTLEGSTITPPPPPPVEKTWHL